MFGQTSTDGEIMVIRPGIGGPICCLSCGYCLAGLGEARCPECGRGFDPSNPATTIPTESCPRQVIKLLTPAKWPAPLAAWLTIIMLAGSSVYFLPEFVVLALWLATYLIVALPFLVRTWARSAVIHFYRINPQLRRVDHQAAWRAKKWLAIGLVLGVLRIPFLILLLMDFPMLSHDAHWLYEKEGMFAKYNTQLMPGPFPATVCSVIPWGVFFKVQGMDVAYCPIDPPPGGVTQYYYHVVGDWYISTDDALGVVP